MSRPEQKSRSGQELLNHVVNQEGDIAKDCSFELLMGTTFSSVSTYYQRRVSQGPGTAHISIAPATVNRYRQSP